jgi:hypothetical protein
MPVGKMSQWIPVLSGNSSRRRIQIRYGKSVDAIGGPPRSDDCQPSKPLTCPHRQELQPEIIATATANGCQDFQSMRNQEFNLEEIIRLYINSGIESHPVPAQFSTSCSHRNGGKPTAGKDADRQIHRKASPASRICVARGHFISWNEKRMPR